MMIPATFDAVRRVAVVANMKTQVGRKVRLADGTLSDRWDDAHLMTSDEAERAVQDLHSAMGNGDGSDVSFFEPIYVRTPEQRHNEFLRKLEQQAMDCGLYSGTDHSRDASKPDVIRMGNNLTCTVSLGDPSSFVIRRGRKRQTSDRSTDARDFRSALEEI